MILKFNLCSMFISHVSRLLMTRILEYLFDYFTIVSSLIQLLNLS